MFTEVSFVHSGPVWWFIYLGIIPFFGAALTHRAVVNHAQGTRWKIYAATGSVILATPLLVYLLRIFQIFTNSTS